ncbi:hypothetical protein GUJ93_ZPchr0009g2021 [Zizania palustris]|uniref:Uncharacterized protein n=1 Tax=Zizania palustris TaxID=103762 RepID=A0A8J5RSK1_ZIZPA|nr:hypothetical protein GUJ93_ZPchr0009g2021 [Zizania palustris]
MGRALVAAVVSEVATGMAHNEGLWGAVAGSDGGDGPAPVTVPGNSGSGGLRWRRWSPGFWGAVAGSDGPAPVTASGNGGGGGLRWRRWSPGQRRGRHTVKGSGGRWQALTAATGRLQ